MNKIIQISVVLAIVICLVSCKRQAQMDVRQEALEGSDQMSVTKEIKGTPESLGIVTSEELNVQKYDGDPTVEIEAEVNPDAKLALDDLKKISPMVSVAKMKSAMEIKRRQVLPPPSPSPGMGEETSQQQQGSNLAHITEVLNGAAIKYHDDLNQYSSENSFGEDELHRSLSVIRDGDHLQRLDADTINLMLYWAYEIVFGGQSFYDAFKSGVTTKLDKYYKVENCNGSILDGCGINSFVRQNVNNYGDIPREIKQKINGRDRKFYPRDMFRERMISSITDQLESIVGKLQLNASFIDGVRSAVNGQPKSADVARSEGLTLSDETKDRLDNGKVIALMRVLAGETPEASAWDWYRTNVLAIEVSNLKSHDPWRSAFVTWMSNVNNSMVQNLIEPPLPASSQTEQTQTSTQSDMLKDVFNREEARFIGELYDLWGRPDIMPYGIGLIQSQMFRRFYYYAWRHAVEGVDLASILSHGLRTITDPGMSNDMPYFSSFPYLRPSSGYIFDVSFSDIEEQVGERCDRRVGGKTLFRPNICATCYVPKTAYEICGVIGLTNKMIRDYVSDLPADSREKIIGLMTDALVRVRTQLDGKLTQEYKDKLNKAMRFGPAEYRGLFYRLLGNKIEGGPDYSCLKKESNNKWSPSDRFYRLEVGKVMIALQAVMRPNDVPISDAANYFVMNVLPEVDLSCIDSDHSDYYKGEWKAYMAYFMDHLREVMSRE